MQRSGPIRLIADHAGSEVKRKVAGVKPGRATTLLMRVLITGGEGSETARIAHALGAAGYDIAAPDTPFDLRLTLGDRRAEQLQVGDLFIDLARRQVRRQRQPIWLTPIEFGLVAHLVRARRTVGRDELLREVWGLSADPHTNALAVHVSRLRRKLGAGAICTCPDGYRIAEAE